MTVFLGRDVTSISSFHHCVLTVRRESSLWKPFRTDFGAFPVPQQLTEVCQSLLCPWGSCSSHTPPWDVVEQRLAAQRSCHNKGVVVAVDRNADEVLGV